jgi:hypothetical protein
MNTSYFWLSVAFLVFAMPAPFAFLSQVLKKTLLGSDKDGWQPFILGVVLFGLGWIVPDYAAGYVLKGLGIVFFLLGILILVDDKWSDKILEPGWGLGYCFVALALLAIGSMKSGFTYNARALLTLVLPVIGATIAVTSALLTIMSEKFKLRLSQDNGGSILTVFGIVLMAVSPFAALNPALMVVTSALGALLLTLGSFIALDDPTALKWLKLNKLIVYIPVFLVCVGLSRWLF